MSITSRRETSVLVAYLFVFFVVTYPLVFHFGSAILGEPNSDAPLFLWNAWEMLHQWSQGTMSLWTQDVLYPHTLSLLYHTYTPVNAACIAVLTLLLHNLVLSFNLYFAIVSVGSAYAMYRWVLLLCDDRWAAFFGGLVFAFQPLWSVYMNAGTQSLLTLWFLPVVFLCTEVFLVCGQKRYMFLAGLVMGLAFWNDLYPFLFCAVGMLLYLVGRRRVVALGVVYGSAFVVMLPKMIGLVRHASVFSGDAHPSIADVDVYHADIVNLFLPWAIAPTTNGNAFFGFAIIGIVVALCVRRVIRKTPIGWSRLHTTLALGACVALVLSWGPFLHLFGYATGIPLPSWLIYRAVPFFTEIRVPLRWVFLVFFFLAPLLAFALRDALAAIRPARRRVVYAVFICVFVLDIAYIPRPLLPASAEAYPAYRIIAQDETPGAVVDIPLSISSGFFHVGEPQQQRSMLYQTIHGKPIIAGHLSRLPRLIESEYRDGADMQQVFERYHPLYIVVHTDELSQEQVDGLSIYIENERNFESVYVDDGTHLYRRQSLTSRLERVF